jgi:hypothetical protein
MTDYDEQFENLLREFQPVQPRALVEGSDSRQSGDLRRLAAAAVLLFGCALSGWFAFRGRSSTGTAQRSAIPAPVIDQTESRQPSLILLTQLALRDPQRLDAVLDAQSRTGLPRFDQPQSTLRVLAKE